MWQRAISSAGGGGTINPQYLTVNTNNAFVGKGSATYTIDATKHYVGVLYLEVSGNANTKYELYFYVNQGTLVKPVTNNFNDVSLSGTTLTMSGKNTLTTETTSILLFQLD